MKAKICLSVLVFVFLCIAVASADPGFIADKNIEIQQQDSAVVAATDIGYVYNEGTPVLLILMGYENEVLCDVAACQQKVLSDTDIISVKRENFGGDSYRALLIKTDDLSVVSRSELRSKFSEEYIVSGGNCIIEAENTIITSDAAVAEIEGASGDKVAVITPGVHDGYDHTLQTGPVLSFKLHIPYKQYGTYNIWMRVQTKNAASFYAEYTGSGKYTEQHSGKDLTDYYWRNIKVNITGEVFYFNVKYRVGTVTFDKFIITRDMTYIPEGATDEPRKNDSSEKYDGNFYPIPEVLPPKEHPRVLVRENDLEKIKENATHPILQKTFTAIENTGLAAIPKTISDNLAYQLQCRACLYLLGEVDEEHAKKTIAAMRDVFQNALWSEMPQRSTGTFLATAGIVYDWCYDVLETEDKKVFIEEILKIAKHTSVGYPPVCGYQTLASVMGEGDLFYFQLSAAIAIYDEYPEMYNIVAGRLFEEFFDSREYFFKTGNHPEGNAYMGTRYQWEALCKIIFDRMGYSDVMGNEAHKPVYRLIYDRLPPGYHFEDGDNYLYWSIKSGPSYYLNDTASMLMASYFTDDPYIRGEFVKQMGIYAYNPGVLICGNSVQVLLLFDPEPPFKYPDDDTADLPLTYVSEYPITDVFMRTSWQQGIDSNTAAVFMKGQEKYIGGHQHADIGNFQIYYKGMLAINGGIYEGQNGGFGSSHHFNYNKRTISKNLVTVFDPDEKFLSEKGNFAATVLSNDGGQKFNDLSGTYTLGDFLKKEDEAKTEGVYVGPDKNVPEFSYLKTNLTNAYSEKVPFYTRSMVAINLQNEDYPLAFVCFDNVSSSNEEFKKTWNLQTVDEPQTDGNITTITRSNYGFSGKLCVKTLLPENALYENVGGEGMESFVNGKNYPNPDKEGYDMEQGGWRLEISPSEKNKDDLFLNAMYVCDKNKNLPHLDMNKFENDLFVGVSVMDKMVLFVKGKEKVSESFEIDLTGKTDNEISLLITDIEKGKWQVSGNGVNEIYEVSEKENSLYVKLKHGIYTFSKASENAAVTEKTYQTVYSQKSRGDFLVLDRTNVKFYYNENPTVVKNSVPYVSADFFEKLDIEIQKNGDTVTAVKGGTNAEILHYFTDGDILYISPPDISGELGYVFSYDSVAKILKIYNR